MIIKKIQRTMKGLDTVESLSAGEVREPNRNMGTIIIIYIFVTFTHSNIDFHTLFKENIRDLTFKHILSLRFGPRAAPAERLSIVSSPFMVGKIFLLLHRFKKVSSLVAGVDNSW